MTEQANQEIADLRQAPRDREDEVKALRARLEAREVQLELAASRLAEAERTIAALHSSVSWRVTRPLRFVVNAVTRLATGTEAVVPLSVRGFAKRLYHAFPLPEHVKWAIVRLVFRALAPLICDTTTYRTYEVIERQRLLAGLGGGSPGTKSTAGPQVTEAPNVARSPSTPHAHVITPAGNEVSPSLQGLPKQVDFSSSGDSAQPAAAHSAPSVRLIAFYLPQFHPIPENDAFWGKGFTEWVNVTRAQPLFEGHYQPHLPVDLGFYDLRIPEVREAQAALARAYGIHGFCYYYYWFNGRRLLSRPLEEVVQTGSPDFPFCICWANEPWSRRWDGSEDEVLVRQEYPDDYPERFIRDVLPILRDPRYIRVNDRPLLLVYRVTHLPNPVHAAEVWRTICRNEGIGEICLAAVGSFGLRDPRPLGFEVGVEFPPHGATEMATIEGSLHGLDPGFAGNVYDYGRCAARELGRRTDYPRFRGLMVGWDNTARWGKRATIFHDASPKIYEQWLRGLLMQAAEASAPYPPLVFVNAWNEWAEGTHLEPDQLHGRAYLEATASALKSALHALNFQLFEQPHARLDTPPEVSIIIPVFNRLDLTLECLRSLLRHRSQWTYEIVVVDDGSTDLTESVLGSIPSIRYIRADQSRGFVHAGNLGAAEARGTFLVFLNHDTIVAEGWLDALRQTFNDWPRAGLVGGKVLQPSGALHDCGTLVYRDGSTADCGRDDDPNHPRYCYARETDYVPAAAMMIPRDVFERVGKFDESFAPGDYADTDLAFRVRAAGFQVVVNPHAVLTRRPGSSAGTGGAPGGNRSQAVNRPKFVSRWEEVLARHPEPTATPGMRVDSPRILVVDWAIPRPDRDSGSVRMAAILRILRDLGLRVTLAARDLSYDPECARPFERIGIEVLRAPHIQSLARHLEACGASYDYVLLSRRDPALVHFDTVKRCCPNATIIFDTVDLHFVREARHKALAAGHAADPIAEAAKARELEIIRRADVTLVVSPAERDLLRRIAPDAAVRIVSNIHVPEPTQSPFEARSGILFIGYFAHPPNEDGVLWFVREVLPQLPVHDGALTLHVVGSDPPRAIRELASEHVRIHGFVPDVQPFFDSCRLSIGPLRYGAGVKGKITQAMALGLPCVLTSIAAEGMYAQDGVNCLLADDPAAFAEQVARLYHDKALWTKIREGGFRNIEAHFSPQVARHELAEILTAEAACRRLPVAQES
jgi:GT2 family glycosyltransferase/glycosyltransferase involved in cell wall biosynthesis